MHIVLFSLKKKNLCHKIELLKLIHVICKYSSNITLTCVNVILLNQSLQLFDLIFYFHIASINILFVQLAYLYQCFLLLNHLSTSLPSQPRKKGIFKWLQDQI